MLDSPLMAPNLSAFGTVTLVVVAAACDWQSRRIPNRLVGSAWLAALAMQIWVHGWLDGSAAWALGWLTGLAMFLPFYLLRGMAAGDVKLMMAVGAWIGARQAFDAAIATFVLGGVWSIGLSLLHGNAAQLFINTRAIFSQWGPRRYDAPAPGRAAASVGAIPYGLAIALGTIGVLFAQA
ncbi:peptidase A24 [Pandoraea cepalis]|uniref:Peptidase A24 n=1 Tax=Pandoraea cepalis TaxID=2508294 RepID=A0AAW7MPB3_9BURK|nr:prepilin peptidase [Pandoraea cepalis]MDN4574621.1 peptidase A24 [Pandoraea cepalis]MDN4580124.1 peptidase A24 [Pandoraea cepalis]